MLKNKSIKVGILVPPRFCERIGPNMMRVLNVGRFRAGTDFKKIEVTPPYEAVVLATYIQSLGYPVAFLDTNCSNLTFAETAEWIRQSGAEVLIVHGGDSTLTQDVIWIAYAEGLGIKGIFWEEILVPHYHEKLFTDFPFIKRLLGEEPEANIRYFLDNIEGEKLYKRGGCGLDLNALPTADFGFLPMERYKREGKRYWLTIPMRNCTWGKCRFCLQSRSSRQNVRLRSIEHIKKELDAVVDKYKIERLFFYTYELNTSIERVNEISEMMKEYKEVEWECFMRADAFNYEMLKNMKDSGCLRIHVGVENVDPRILKANVKGVTPEQIVELFAYTKKLGIERAAYVVIGTPSEDAESIDVTSAFIRRIKPDLAYPAMFRPFPGVAMEQELREKGLIERDFYEAALAGDCTGTTVSCRTLYMTSAEVKKAYERLVRETKLSPLKLAKLLWIYHRQGVLLESVVEELLSRIYAREG